MGNDFRLRKVVRYSLILNPNNSVDSLLINLTNRALAKMGLKNKSEFVRMSLKEKAERVLGGKCAG